MQHGTRNGTSSLMTTPTTMNIITRTFKRLVTIVTGLFLAGCTEETATLTPVRNFDAARYLGRWYEIARLPNRFEEGLADVRAEYAPRDTATITVVNTGYDVAQQRWRSVRGIARFAGARDVGHLRVSFFRPFYASYKIIALDTNAYQYALVTGNDFSYLWLLARTPQLPDATRTMLIERAAALGFATNRLIYVVHDRDDAFAAKE